MSGGGHLVAFTCVDGHGNILMPCGRCRQLLYEHSAEGMLLETVSGIRTIDEVLPDAFGPRQLAAYAAEHEQRLKEHSVTDLRQRSRRSTPST